MPSKIIAAASLSLALAATTAEALDFPVVSAQVGTDQFVLNVDEAGPGVKALLAGDYDLAIQRARRASRLGEPLSAYLTLCAGYVAKGDLARAEAACDKAVKRARAPVPIYQQAARGPDRLGLAMAYSNRGVFHALTGDSAGASEDFAQARRQGTIDTIVDANERRSASSGQLASVE